MNIKTVIGNTPMAKIRYRYFGKEREIYTKLEMFNLTGSIKDRVAYYMIKNAKEKGVLKENIPIIEATSGNTGISLSALGAYYKHPVYIFMPDWASKERIALMKLYGANLKLISKGEGGFIKCVEEAKKLAKEVNGFLANQFENEDNILAHYETTGKEIIEQLKEIGGFVSGVGTGGTLIGIGKRLKEENSKTKVVALEPQKMPILSNGKILGQHKIEGIGDDFVPEIFNRNKDIVEEDIILINDDDAINMARKLSKELGLGVGISSGANFLGAVLLQKKLQKPIVTVFADDSKKYLSTDLTKEINESKDLMSNQIELLSYEEAKKLKYLFAQQILYASC